MIKPHWKFDMLVFVGFPKTHRKVAGVYKIDDIYIGASQHIRSRIIAHMNRCLAGDHAHKALMNHINSSIRDGKQIVIERMSDNPFDELKIKQMFPDIKMSYGEKVYSQIYEK